jgi:hypothetical protein
MLNLKKRMKIIYQKKSGRCYGGIRLVKPFNAFTGNQVVRYAQVTTPNQVAGIVHNGRQLVLSFILLRETLLKR